MNTKKFITFLLIVALLFTGCSHISIPTNANAAFQNYTLCLFQQEVCANTINLHYSLQNPEKYGITDAPVTLGSFDFDATATLAAIENLEASLHKFSYNSLSKENQLTYDILSHYFDSAKTDAEFYLYSEPLSPVTGIHAQLPVLLAEYQFYDESDIETYLVLLESMPDYFASLIRFQQQKAKAGLFMSDNVVDDVIEQCNAFVSMGDENYLLSTFEERISSMENLTSNTYTKFIQQNKNILSSSVIPAYATLAAALSDLKGTGKNTQGLCNLPEGKEYYRHLIHTETGSGRTIQELKELIQTQIATDLLCIQSVLEENPSILKATNLATESPDDILTTLETKIAKTFPNSADVNVEIKYVPKALEEYLSPAFYLIPSIDNFTENTIYINGAHSPDGIHLFTTLAHEGYPGHLYQTTYFANMNPDPIRALINFPGYVEGWATYAEMCSYYISSLDKPHATLLQKNNSLVLGLYAMADIGIHSEGWNTDDTLKHFSSYGIGDEDTVREIFNYIIGDPANYLSYYVGYLEMLELKKELKLSHKDFHKKILEVGPAPFDILKKHLR